MLKELGDAAIVAHEFDPKAPSFSSVLSTTWRELESRFFVDRLDVIGGRTYLLTGDGWFRALELAGDLKDQHLLRRLSTLAAALKSSVKGRQEDTFLYVDAVASQTGLSVDWIFNAIEARLLDRQFKRRGAEWADRGRRRTVIRVPLDFGHEPL